MKKLIRRFLQKNTKIEWQIDPFNKMPNFTLYVFGVKLGTAVWDNQICGWNPTKDFNPPRDSRVQRQFLNQKYSSPISINK